VTDLHKVLSCAVKEYSSKIFIFDSRTRIKYEQLPTIIGNIYEILKESGLEKGDIAGVSMPRGPLLALVYLTCFFAGITALPVSAERPFTGMLFPGFPVKRIISDKNTIYGYINLSGHDLFRRHKKGLPEIYTRSGDTVYLNLTSGTTSNPKAARCDFSGIYYNTDSVIDYFGFDHNDTHLCMFPAHLHPHEFFIRPLMTGGSAFIPENLLPRDIPFALEANRITALMATPAVQKAMIEFSRAPKQSYRFTGLFEAGGMITDISLRRVFPKKTGRDITPVWGSTETLGVSLALDPEMPMEPNLIGSPIKGYDICKKPLEDGSEEGIMIIKGRGLMKGYFSGTDIGGSFETGDIVLIDDNSVYFLGRVDKMIKKGGMRIYPEELSSRIDKLGFVKESAVLPVDHTIYGKDIVLFLVLEKKLTIKEIKKALLMNLEQHEIPHSIKIMDSIPRYSSGKINYNDLKDSLQEPE